MEFLSAILYGKRMAFCKKVTPWKSVGTANAPRNVGSDFPYALL
jgi:hypothetical protein